MLSLSHDNAFSQLIAYFGFEIVEASIRRLGGLGATLTRH